jgi:hypothetical protein
MPNTSEISLTLVMALAGKFSLYASFFQLILHQQRKTTTTNERFVTLPAFF